jgi:DNA-binding CsgD family transcriptional regulator
MLATWSHRSADRVVALSIQGTRGRGAFTAEERDRLAHVLPHITRAIELKDRLALGADVSTSLISIADALTLGILLVDARGRVLEASRVAQRILAEADGLFTASGRIAFRRGIDGQVFSRLLTTSSSLDASAPTLTIPRQRSRLPLSLLLAPIRSACEPWITVTQQWIVMIQERNEIHLPEPDNLAHEWHITPAEARVACLLAGGSSVAQIAAALHVSTHTVRTQLKSVYAKTGAASQLEVVRRLLSDAAHRPAAIPP